jgi:hypothetical protein
MRFLALLYWDPRAEQLVYLRVENTFLEIILPKISSIVNNIALLKPTAT